MHTEDVLCASRSFRDLLLPEAVVRGLEDHGFVRPSPVQQEAIPLARLGSDLIVQAKAGTGKTLVFAVAAVERVDLSLSTPQVVILTPTREIALQCTEAVNAASAALPPPGLVCGTFIGGLPTEEDEKILRRVCHVAVGTPGRLLALLQRGSLVPSRLRLLVLDEADKLLGASLAGDVAEILGALPPRRQTVATSATYDDDALRTLRGLMRRPREVRLCVDGVALRGVRQFYALAGSTAAAAGPSGPASSSGSSSAAGGSIRGLPEAKVCALLEVLASVPYQQAVVFCNRADAAEALAARLAGEGHPAAFLSAQRQQLERIEALNALRDFRLRVAVCSDLVSRGVDLDRVNLVVCMDIAEESATHMHRVGRSGRFGTRGVAVTLVGGERELSALRRQLQEADGGEVLPLPDAPERDVWCGELSQPALDAAAGPGAEAPGDAAGAAGEQAQRPALPRTPNQPAECAARGASLADVATASLWADEPRGLPSPPHGAWPLEPAAWLTPDSPPPRAAADATAALLRQGGWEAGRARNGAGLLGVAKGLEPVDPGAGALAGSGHGPSRPPTLCVLGGGYDSTESEPDSWASTSDDVLSSADDEGPAAAPAALRRQRSLPAAIPRGRGPPRAALREGGAAEEGSEQEEEEEGEHSFKDSWLGAGSGARRPRRAPQAADDQLRLRPHAELDPDPEAGAVLGDKLLAGEGGAAAGAPLGHYWTVVQSAAHDVLGQADEADSLLAAAFEPVVPAPQQHLAERGPQAGPGGHRQRRPLGSSQATALRRQLEEEAAAAAEQWSNEEEEEEEQEWEGQEEPAAAGAEGSYAAWADYWQRHYEQYGFYPTEESLAGQAPPTVPPPALPPPPQQAAAGAAPRPPAMRGPPPAPPPPPPAAAPPLAQLAGPPGLPFQPDAEGFVRVPAALLARYQVLEWQEWQRGYAEWQRSHAEWQEWQNSHGA